MRRYVRRLILIGILVGLAAASIGVQHINFSFLGGHFDRGGDTPLGLTLGLDLKGGSHLVYQARKDITVSFTEPVSVSQVEEALAIIGRTTAKVERGEGNEIIIGQASLEQEEREAIRQALIDNVGPIASFEVSLDPSQEQIEGVMSIIERRVNAFGVAEPSIQLMGSNRILVQLPNIDIERARDLIGETATLEFKERTVNAVQDLDIASEDVISVAPEQSEDGEKILLNLTLTTDASKVFREFIIRLTERTQETAAADDFAGILDALVLSLDGEGGRSFEITSDMIETKEADTFLLQLPNVGTLNEAKDIFGDSPRLKFQERFARLDTPLGLTGKDLTRAFAGQHQTNNEPIVNIQFNDRGTRIFADVTRRIAGTPNQIAILLDGEELLSPVAQQAITGGSAFISGRDFTFDRVRTMAIQLESGRLPVPIEVVQERTVDATLGKDSLKKSAIAGLIGLGVVLLFMVIYYRAAGLVAGMSLVIYTVLVLAIFKLWPITLTLSGVAAFILSIGMAVDANILIFERMKEELRTGRTLGSSITEGFNRAWTSIRDSNISTIITCAILFWFGNQLGTSIIQGFALTLFVGVLLSMFTAITVSRTLLRVLGVTPLAKRINWILPLEGEPVGRTRRVASEEPL